jgi:hypothetical protein
VYGGVDLLRSPLKVGPDDSGELLIDLAISGRSPAVSVSGHVTGIAPGQVHRISLREPTAGDLAAALETSVGPDGAFTFPKVLPGNYIVYLRLCAQTQVTVGDKDVTGLTVAYPRDILVSGHVIYSVRIASTGSTDRSPRGAASDSRFCRVRSGFTLSAMSGIPFQTVYRPDKAWR